MIFRCDGNQMIGCGHVMRCMSIADAGKKMGYKCIFLTASDEYSDKIIKHGHEVRILNSDYRNMSSDMKQTLKAVKIFRPSVFFADSYFLTESYLFQLWKCCKSTGCRLICLNDNPSFPFPCDVLINYNIYGTGKREEYRILYSCAGKKMPKLLLGTEYVPLRPEFENISERKINEHALNILVSVGGTDSAHVAVRFTRVIKELNSNYIFHIMTGLHNEDQAEMQFLADNSPGIVLHDTIQNMAEFMKGCDVAVSAAGSTLYELCAVQTPAVTYAVADNQILGAKEFAFLDIFPYMGDIRKDGADKLVKSLIMKAAELAGDYHERVRISGKQKYVTDGKGAERIVQQCLA